MPPVRAMRESDILKTIVDDLRAAFNVKQIVLFGSRARQAARPDSDFDILAIVESEIPYRRRQGVAMAAIRDDVNVEMDLFVLTPDELARSLNRFESVTRRALAEGSVIYAA